MSVLIHMLYFLKCRMGCAVCIDNSVQTKISICMVVVRCKIATKLPVLSSIFINGCQTLINKIPNKPTLHLAFAANHIPQISDVSVAIAHGMRIFTPNKRSVWKLTQIIFFNHFHRCIHPRKIVGMGFQININICLFVIRMF